MRLLRPSPPAATGGSKAKPRKKAKKAKKQSKRGGSPRLVQRACDTDQADPAGAACRPYGAIPKGQRTRIPEVWDFDARRPAPVRSQDSTLAEEVVGEEITGPKEEEQLVRGIFDPGQRTSDKQVVFGAGEWEAVEGEGDDWEEEPDG
ncbi:hypothetical protein CALVIDRAFT_558840 [Calocera viscosa TUFC12733]|uniref:Uncharacterized protein n=1 Tax=Calocera viscosa (strain TUFC12733) TaxID=1330018 RepID=A0A167G593_CALVF|nr:hypothetical protein CALVIDRAFT_558840 [Calocera viscosa TUFC12733]